MLAAALLLAACNTTATSTATQPPAPKTPSGPPSAIPATATAAPSATTAATDTAVPPTVVPGPTTGLLIAAPDKSVAFIGLDGQPRPLDEAPATIYVLANLAADPNVQQSAYAVGPQGAKSLDFVKPIGQGFASYTGPDAPGRLAWDNWTGNSDTGLLDSQIIVSGLDGSQAAPALKESGDHVLHVIRWAADGQHLYFSREPLGLGGYILFAGFSNLSVLDVASGATTVIVPDGAAGVICLDDFTSDESQVAHHCVPQAISILSPAASSLTQVQPPPEVSEFGQHGDARFSPDGSRLAFALARGEPDNEQGWVAVSNGVTGAAHLVATSDPADYFSVWGWLDAQTLVLQSHAATPGIWLVSADGANLHRVVDGTLLSVVGP